MAYSKEQIRQYQKEHYAKNKDKHAKRRSSPEHKKLLEEYNSRPDVKEAQRLKRQSYREKNLEKIKEKEKLYYQRPEVKERVRKKRESGYYKSYLQRPEVKIKELHRNRLQNLAKKQKAKKYIETSHLFGTSMKKVVKHIEDQFVEGMSWDNHGEWHIDHIKPLCSFDLNNLEEQKKAFHFTNLQPLWALDNLIKGSSFQEQ